MVRVDLSKVQPMIALPFHPSNVYTIKELNENAEEILRNVDGISLADKIVDGKILVDQGIVAGCSGGTFENITKMAAILDGKSVGSDYFNLSVYPSSQPVYSELLKNGAAGKLMESGAVMKTAFCGPCFGAGDVPNNNGFSIRHTTRNFPSREGSKPGAGQIAAVALMDATSIAATALNGGILTPATEVYIPEFSTAYSFNGNIYGNRVYQGHGKADTSLDLKFGPNITDWPKMPQLADNMLLKFAAVIYDEVTTTDELIPSGETSSYRSNPLKLAEFTLSRKEPLYVERAKATQALNGELQNGVVPEELKKVFDQVEATEDMIKNTGLGSVVYANKPGDGSAREQAASCQKVLGGTANIAVEYATKRYRSNLINWGMLPFTIDQENSVGIENGDYVFVEGIRAAVEAGKEEIKAKLVGSKGVKEVTLYFKNLTKDERDIILAGCLINYYGKDK